MITWNTIQGVLGSVYNYQSYNFYLNATSNVTSNITYSDLTLSLPDGAFLESNGYIYGTALVTEAYSSNGFAILAEDGVSNASAIFTINRLPFEDQITWISPSNNFIQTVVNNSTNVNISLIASSKRGQIVNYTSNSLPDGVRIIGSKLSGIISGNTNLINNTSIITASTYNQNVKSNIYINWNIKDYIQKSGILYANATTINEGQTVRVSLQSSDFEEGEKFYWHAFSVVAGVNQSLFANSFIESANLLPYSYGTTLFSSGFANVDIPLYEDEVLKGNSNLYFTITNMNGSRFSLSEPITIEDTSNSYITKFEDTFAGAQGGNCEVSFYMWYAPPGVSNVSVVVVGGGGSGSPTYSYGPTVWGGYGGEGGSLAWKNNIPVQGGCGYLVGVGSGGGGGGDCQPIGTNTLPSPSGGCSFFISMSCVSANGGGGGGNVPSGPGPARSGWVGDCGGCGGRGGIGNCGALGSGGGGAGGYGGFGGTGGTRACPPCHTGQGGYCGGGKGGSGDPIQDGGGVGLLGMGNSGPGGSFITSFYNGSCWYTNQPVYGGGGGANHIGAGNPGCPGAVRIIWETDRGRGIRNFSNYLPWICCTGNLWIQSPGCWSNISSTFVINSGCRFGDTGGFLTFSRSDTKTTQQNTKYELFSGELPPTTNILTNGTVISNLLFVEADTKYDFKVKASNILNPSANPFDNVFYLPYSILVKSRPEINSSKFVFTTPSNNSVIPAYIGNNNTEVLMRTTNFDNYFGNLLYFSSNSLPDGMYIKNNYIVGVPSGNSNLLSGNVSIVTANFSSNIFPINFYSNLYINWNLY